MLIDMHIHEKTYSDDSFIELKQIICKAQSMGLDGICITDHDSMGLVDQAAQVSREMNFPVFVGAEILTYQGDILVFGVDHIPGEMMQAQQLIDWTNQHGGVAVSAHPYRKNGRGIGDGLYSLKGLAGIEGLNGSTPYHLNAQARETALAMDIPLLGSSDAHLLERVGMYATLFEGSVRDMKDLTEGIKAGGVSPVHYTGGAYRSYDDYFNREVAV
ncbi:PHP domain-containing protein [Anoxynatronum buryatiense]|uniref:PHP domain-containing protein n=1 Tax=Anoxynatronum buryatiense TaxID=489973 RepID=A0AA46AKH0_9CLOT|nr:PHP domain-containing protein [Anoxynatronum buryatiense]SMP70691.1 hypothetical protein SAMN06296020_1216 [Anoxynatronum buryatiense]